MNSENLGPYGDAITYELLPYLEKQFRGIGGGKARFMYGGSTGGWEAMAVQIFYPDEYNGAWCACPDPIDFRAYTVVDIYKDENAYSVGRPLAARPAAGHAELPRPREAHPRAGQPPRARPRHAQPLRPAVGHLGGGLLAGGLRRLSHAPLGQAHGRDRSSGGGAVAELRPRPTSCAATGTRGWGPKLQGKLNLYVGDMDNYYLNNAVYLVEDFLKKADPPFGGEVDYGDRAEHCWNGDHTQPNAISRLRYHQMFVPKAVARLKATTAAR